jgi:hypothetical protein
MQESDVIIKIPAEVLKDIDDKISEYHPNNDKYVSHLGNSDIVLAQHNYLYDVFTTLKQYLTKPTHETINMACALMQSLNTLDLRAMPSSLWKYLSVGKMHLNLSNGYKLVK